MAKRAPARRRPRKDKPGTKGPDPAQCRLEQSEGYAADAAEAVENVANAAPSPMQGSRAENCFGKLRRRLRRNASTDGGGKSRVWLGLESAHRTSYCDCLKIESERNRK